MQTVPSLVGIGSAVAAAAAGMVFGQAPESLESPDPPRPHSNKRKTIDEADDAQSNRQSAVFATSRPATSSAAHAPPLEDAHFHTINPQFLPTPTTATSSSRPPRPLSTHITPPKASSRRHSFIRQGDFAGLAIAEDVRDSVSSHGSWMRRLSVRPLSQHGSPRSSVGPDSPSVTFSHGSSAPILSPTGTVPPQLPPNKLVKRAPNSYNGSVGTVTRRRSRSHLPTLRRPATSHQRSATLQQFQYPGNLPESVGTAKYSFDQQIRGPETLSSPIIETVQESRPLFGWTSFFHARAAKSNSRGTPGRVVDSSPTSRSALPSKRICLDHQATTAPYLVHASMISTNPAAPQNLDPVGRKSEPERASKAEEPIPSPEDTPSKRARRSISMHFSSPTSWISKTGSIRRPKRGQDSKPPAGKRHVSAPVTAPPPNMMVDFDGAITDGAAGSQTRDADFDVATVQPKQRKRNSSSPLPPLSRLSSFNIDLNKLGASASNSAPQPRQKHPSGSSQGSLTMAQYRSTPHERSSTMNSSDLEARDFMSADDDDTDFKSDTMFDSIRTVASGRHRTVETPLESMFDESPPSTAGNNTKTKRLSIQEILGKSWDGDDRIMEEDEGISTPVRGTSAPRGEFSSRDEPHETRFSFDPVPHDISMSNRDLSRLSIDDDFDEDWARDDSGVSNHLSPPNSLNSRVISPNMRVALASISGNGTTEASQSDAASERPLSNLFDWSEPSIHDKLDADGSPRPRTALGKQEIDMRGGRSAVRRGPTAAHVRSQSVPVVHDPQETAKSATSKFGTWGLGTKTVSEDWDDDFEFEEMNDNSRGGKSAEKPFSMMVPASIQASQPSVKAHSGQIREFSLLVNDLKRLCRRGRDLDMLDGPQSGLWKEAEGIIALASPDEEGVDGMDADSADFEPSIMGEQIVDDGFDAVSEHAADTAETQEQTDARSSVLRERQAGRRRSVFSPDDDIFGGSEPAPEDRLPELRPRTPENNSILGNGSDINTVVRSMMEAMQNRSASDPSPLLQGSAGRLHFGSNSLKALVKRAGDLRDVLSEIVRRADPIAPSPARTPRRLDNDSPAFTRVFTDPQSSPPRRLPQSRSNNSALGRNSIEASPSGAINQRMMMTTVS